MPGDSHFSGSAHQSSAALRESVVALWHKDRSASTFDKLSRFTEKQWHRNLLWLDASGLALYLLAELESERCLYLLPTAILARLQQNRIDNRARTEDLRNEMVSLSTRFQRAGLQFANMKGLALPPEAVPDPALRLQLDLDFLVASSDADAAREILEEQGYELHVKSGRNWEFRAGATAAVSIADLYKVKPQRAVELHLLDIDNPAGPYWSGRLQRAVPTCVGGAVVPALSPTDAFLGQAHHIFAHLRGEFTRVAWVLEFTRHFTHRYGDVDFWLELERLAEGNKEIADVVGLCSALARDLFGMKIPFLLSRWSLRQLSPAYALWAEVYGKRALMCDYPGTKLFLFLDAALSKSRASIAPTGKRLLPARLPACILRKPSGERLMARTRRYRIELGYLVSRMRFHLMEGSRCLPGLLLWRRLLRELPQ